MYDEHLLAWETYELRARYQRDVVSVLTQELYTISQKDDKTPADYKTIRALQKQITKAQAAVPEVSEFSVRRRLANYLHDYRCHRSHSDECGWYYHAADNEYEHEKYLKQADRIIAEKPEQVQTLLDAFETLTAAKEQINSLL